MKKEQIMVEALRRLGYKIWPPKYNRHDLFIIATKDEKNNFDVFSLRRNRYTNRPGEWPEDAMIAKVNLSKLKWEELTSYESKKKIKQNSCKSKKCSF